MQSPVIPARHRSYWIFLVTLSLLAIVIGGIVTSRYGAGVASDSVKYLGVAQSVLDGKGLYDHRGGPLLSWPPLYSIIIAGFSRLTGLDVFIAAWYLNLFVLGLNLFLSGVIFYRVFSAKMIYVYLGVVFVFLSNPSLRIHSVISSDPLYLTMVFALVLAVDRYIKRSYSALLVLMILSAFAPLHRYVGLAIGATAGLVILIEHWRSPRIWLRDGLLVGVSTVLPIGWWLLIHNVMTHGSLWGLDSQIVDTGRNLSLGLTKILHWFVPYLSFLMPVLLRPWTIIAVVIVLLVLLNRKSRAYFRAWLDEVREHSTYPILLHGLVYFSAVTLTAISADHRDLYSDRYYFVLLVPILLLLFITFDKLILPHLRLSMRQVEAGLIVLFAVWSLYPLYTLREYVAEARDLGEPSGYNMFNTSRYQKMDLIAEMRELRMREPQAVVYSNYVDAVWFYTRQPVTLLPVLKDDPAEGYGDWPGDKPGYIVWFEPNEYKHYISPKQIQAFADLQLIYQGDGGKLYYVQKR